MSFGLGSSLSNSALLNFNTTQSNLYTSFNRLSTGKRINSAADDPSGLAIAQTLQAQVDGFNAAAQNVSTANNALNVAQGALSTTSDILQRLNSLAVEANNGFNSPQQSQYLQTEANQLTQQINTISQNTQFNGTQLLDGSVAGPQPGNPPSVAIPSNADLSGGGTIVSSVAANSPNFFTQAGPAQGFGGTSTLNSTIQIQIVNNNGVAAAQVSATDTATGQTVTSPVLVASGGVANQFENVNVQLGNFTLADVGQTATIQIQQGNAATNTGNALNIQDASNEGATVQIGIPAVSTQNLQVNSIDLTTQANATNSQGQIDNAIQELSGIQSTIGAQTVALNYNQDNDQIASVNLTAAQSNIQDANIPSETTKANQNQLLNQIDLYTLRQANLTRGYLTGLLNAAA